MGDHIGYKIPSSWHAPPQWFTWKRTAACLIGITAILLCVGITLTGTSRRRLPPLVETAEQRRNREFWESVENATDSTATEFGDSPEKEAEPNSGNTSQSSGLDLATILAQSTQVPIQTM